MLPTPSKTRHETRRGGVPWCGLLVLRRRREHFVHPAAELGRAVHRDERGRGVGGGFLFSLPLLFTMEVWTAAASLSPARLAVGLVAATAVAVLAGIVLVRTVLSLVMEVEISGRWPWQRGSDAEAGPTGR